MDVKASVVSEDEAADEEDSKPQKRVRAKKEKANIDATSDEDDD